jgi:hypothetical protein
MLTDKELEGLETDAEREAAQAIAAAFDRLPPLCAMEWLAYQRAMWTQARRRAFKIV